MPRLPPMSSPPPAPGSPSFNPAYPPQPRAGGAPRARDEASPRGGAPRGPRAVAPAPAPAGGARKFTLLGGDRALDGLGEPAGELDAMLGAPDGDDRTAEVTSDQLVTFAKNMAESEIRKASENLRVSKMLSQAQGAGSLDDALYAQLQTLDENGDGEISGDEVVAFAKSFAEKQVALMEERAKVEAAEAEARQLRRRLGASVAAILVMASLLAVSTAANLLGTTKVVKNYHFVETRGDALTNEAGDTLQCASAEFTYVAGASGDNATASSSTLTTRGGEAVATKSADFDTASGVLAGASGQALAARAAQGSTRERNSQLQRLRSRPFSTRSG